MLQPLLFCSSCLVVTRKSSSLNTLYFHRRRTIFSWCCNVPIMFQAYPSSVFVLSDKFFLKGNIRTSPWVFMGQERVSAWWPTSFCLPLVKNLAVEYPPFIDGVRYDHPTSLTPSLVPLAESLLSSSQLRMQWATSGPELRITSSGCSGPVG